jgi:hypothetical protein
VTATLQLDRAAGARRQGRDTGGRRPAVAVRLRAVLGALALSLLVCIGPDATGASAAGVTIDFIDGPADGAMFRQGATLKVVLRAGSSSPLSEVSLTVRLQDGSTGRSVERRIAWPYDPQQRVMNDVVAGELTLTPREDKTFEIIAMARSGSATASATRTITVTPRGTHTANPGVGMRKIEALASADGGGRPYAAAAPDQRAASGATSDDDSSGTPPALLGGGVLATLLVGGAVVVLKRR